MSLLHSLPAPQQTVPETTAGEATTAATVRLYEPPPYLRRTDFVPRKEADFGDGGAFPEIPVAQYPLGMGRQKEVAKTLAVTIDADGDVNYDEVVKQGQNRQKTIYSRHSDIVPKVGELNNLESRVVDSDDEEVKETARATWESLQRVVDKKIQVANPKTVGPLPGPAQFIKYTPSQQGHQFNSGCSQRIVKLQEMPQDPLDPPKFRHTRVPKGPGEPPVPILHSPPRKITYQDQQDWKIPPCVSNWKNPKGYTIPLDKRLAADGRGLQETTVSEKFAAFTESLYSAEHKARESLHMRNKVQKELLAREKEKKEKELRELAQRARMEHGGIPLNARVDASVPVQKPKESPIGRRSRSHSPGRHKDRRHKHRNERSDVKKEEINKKKHRDEIREERRRERERERRLEARDAKGTKKSKVTRDRERDISEKIALGMANVQTGKTGEAMYDSRLFNQDRGMTTGFGADDAYAVYDKPLFVDRGSGLYKPKKVVENDDMEEDEEEEGGKTRRFKADTGFKGAEEPVEGARTGPVEFDLDPYGLDNVIPEKPASRTNALEKLGRRGGMSAAAGGSTIDGDGQGGSSRTKIRFQQGSE